MTLPTSGTLRFPDDLVAEFGSPGGTPALSDYYRGGGLVPDISPNTSIPTSGTIRFPDDFYGTTSFVLEVSGNPPDFSDASGTNGEPGTARVNLTANASVSWSYNLISGPAVSTGGGSGTTTFVELTASPSVASTIDVTATFAGDSVTRRCSLAIFLAP